jgi:hypothetical protein
MFLIKHICFYLIIILSISNVNECLNRPAKKSSVINLPLIQNPSIYQALIKLSDNGFQFQPVNYAAQILLTSLITGKNLLKSCSTLCNENILCQIFDINAVVPNQCRTFQGDIIIHGNITSSTTSNAQVGYILYTSDLFVNYGQSCSSNSPENRYLICRTNFTWECPQNTYWDQSVSVCLAQSSLLGSTCQQNLNMCREDLNYTCL